MATALDEWAKAIAEWKRINDEIEEKQNAAARRESAAVVVGAPR